MLPTSSNDEIIEVPISEVSIVPTAEGSEQPTQAPW